MNAEKMKELRGLLAEYQAANVRGDLRTSVDAARKAAMEIPALLTEGESLLEENQKLKDEVEALRRHLQLTVDAAKWWADNQDSPKSALSHFEWAANQAREALAARHEPTKSPQDLKDAER